MQISAPCDHFIKTSVGSENCKYLMNFIVKVARLRATFTRFRGDSEGAYWEAVRFGFFGFGAGNASNVTCKSLVKKARSSKSSIKNAGFVP